MKRQQPPWETIGPDEEYYWVPAELVKRLKLDALDAQNLSKREARWIVDYYHMLQRHRIRIDQQMEALKQTQEPHRLFDQVGELSWYLERNLKTVMLAYSQSQRVGRWMMSLPGIAETLSAGFLAYLSVEDRTTVGHWWRYAGLDPTVQWLGKDKAEKLVHKAIEDLGGPKQLILENGEIHPDVIARIAVQTQRKYDRLYNCAIHFARFEDKDDPVCSVPMLVKAVAMRPWNDGLKAMCWNLGECFIKVGTKKSVYAKLITERKALEVDRNEKGMNAEAAQAELRRGNYGRGTTAYKCYKNGMLPPKQLHSRARRYGVKLFLSHLHHVMWWERFDEAPPKPYVLEHMGDKHVDMIEPPNFPYEGLGEKSKRRKNRGH